MARLPSARGTINKSIHVRLVYVLHNPMTDLLRYASMVSLTSLFPKRISPKRLRSSVRTSPDRLWEPRNLQLFGTREKRV